MAIVMQSTCVVPLAWPIGASTAGMTRAIPVFKNNNIIVFILQNLQHATPGPLCVEID